MSLRRTLKSMTAGLLLRNSYRELKALRAAVEAQNVLLTRVCNHLLPVPAAPDSSDADSGAVDHLDPFELGLALEYEAKMRQSVGRDPTDEEIIAFLAEEKTRAFLLQDRQRRR